MPRLGSRLSALVLFEGHRVSPSAVFTLAMIADLARRPRSTWAESGVQDWLAADGIGTLVAALEDASPPVRETAAKAIDVFGANPGEAKRWRATSVLAHLLGLLHDDEPRTAQAAVAALGSLAVHKGLRADLVALDGVRALLDASHHPDPATSAAALRALLPLCADPRKESSSLDSLPVEALLSADWSTVTRTCSWTTPGLCDAFRDQTVLDHLSDVALSEDPEPAREALICLAALLKDNRPDLERLREKPLAGRLLGMARADGLEDPGSIETAAWAVLCRLMSNPTPAEVDSWVDRHARVFGTADVLVLSGFRVDWATLRGSFSLTVDGQRCRRRFALFASEGPTVKACPPMFHSPMGAPSSYGAVELPDAAYWALQAAVARLFPSLLPYGARTSGEAVVDRETPLAERATNKSAFETTRREVGRRGFRLTVAVRGDEAEPTRP